MTQQFDTPTTTLFCANHPNRETGLRCKRCEKPICTQCARLTPVGYICPECRRSQQKTFETATWVDYPLAIVVGGVLSFLGSMIASRLGFLVLFIAPMIGVGIAEVVRWVVRRRRAPRLFQWSTAAVALGSAPYLLITLVSFLLASSQGVNFAAGGLLGLVYRLIYTVLVASSFYYRLSGIQIR